MKIIFCFILFLLSSKAHASFELGVGTTSSTSGRLVPALSGTADFDNFALTGSSTGTRTSVYYLSAYTLGAVKRWVIGSFWGADLKVGFGFGFAYSQYGYRESATAELDNKSDLTGGPMFQFRWSFLKPAYLGLDALFGLKYPTGVLALALQDVIVVSVGISL